MLACRSQIPAIHSSPACDSPNEDDENKHICIICISSEAKLALNSLDTEIGVFESSYTVLLPR